MNRDSASGKPGQVLAVVLATFVITAAVNLQVPLYPAYAKAAGQGTGVVTLVFSCYVGGLLPVLIFFGGISDRIGRKPSILLAIACALSATLLVWLHPTLGAVTVARFLQGIGVGLGAGTGTALLAELLEGSDAPQRAAAYVTAATSLGFGSGALFTSLCLVFQSTLTPASYLLFQPAALLALLAVARVPEQRIDRRTPWVRLPHFRRELVPQCLAISLAWAITGMVIAVVPAQLERHQLVAWTGLALFLVNGAGALCQPLARRMNPIQALKLGLLLAPTGYSLLALGAWLGWVPLVLAGAAIAGAACYGFTYLAGLAAISAAVEPHQRARAASGYFLFAYLGFSLPVILSGFLSDWLGAFAALTLFGAFVIAANLFVARRLSRASATGDLEPA